MASLLLSRPIRTSLKLSLLMLALCCSACSHLIFQPMRQHVYSPAIVDVEFADVWLESEEGLMLHGWRLESTTPRRGTVLYLHGNAENISTHFGAVYWLTEHGFDVLLFDYRGYGRSMGEVELDGVVRDVSAMLDHTLDMKAEQPLIVMGHSLGGALAIQSVAASPRKQEVGAVIAIASFSDYHRVARDLLDSSWLTWALQWPLSWTIDNTYSPEEYVGQITPVPLLIMHGRQDRIIDFEHAVRLYAAAKVPKQFIEVHGGHNRIFDIPENKRLLLEYLDSVAVQAIPR